MITPQAEAIKAKLFQNKDLDYLLKTDITVQRKDWEDSIPEYELPEGIAIQRKSIKNVDVEVIQPASPKPYMILYFHGGGMTLGSCITHRKMASYIADITNMPVLVHNYPLAPEHPFPAALDFSEQVYLWLFERGYGADQIIFGGDSSGCALALSLMLKLKDNGCTLPKAVFLFSPMLDFTLSGKTIKTLAQKDPCLFEEDIRASIELYCNGVASGNPYITPLNASFEEFPPLLIQVGSSEILLDDALRLSKMASSAGVDVCLEIWDEMWHVFQGKIGELPEAEEALKNVNTFLTKTPFCGTSV